MAPPSPPQKPLPMQYLFIDITISPYAETTSDILTALLSNIGFDSFELTDTGLKAYIPEEDFNEEYLRGTLDSLSLPDTQISYTLHTLENKDWNTEWEQNSFDPILEREFGIRLNPRMAFGSGSHDTTHQLTSLLFSDDFSGQRTLDMGTGTGVLAIAMAMRGAREVVAIDIDEFSVENAQENLALNNINNVSVLLGDASAIEGEFQTIVANIHKNILISDMPIYVEHLAPHGTLILSGFFTDDVPDMKKAALANHLSIVRTVEQNSWTVMVLQKN